MYPNRRYPISIMVNQIWAGSGAITQVSGGYTIQDCSAQFCRDNDSSMEVYDLIENAIEKKRDSIKVVLDGEIKIISWTITR